MDKKYEMLMDEENTIMIGPYTLHRIRALRDFGKVKKGDLGGFIEKESNLSHEGNSWVYYNAKVFGDAQVYGNARIYGNAQVYGNVRIFNYARVFGDAQIYENVEVFGNAWVFENAHVYGYSQVYGNAKVYGNAWLHDAQVSKDARINGRTRILAYAHISNNAYITSENDYLLFKGFGKNNGFTTFYKCEDGKIMVTYGCFNGDLEEFRSQVKKTHGDDIYSKEYLSMIEMVKIHFRIE